MIGTLDLGGIDLRGALQQLVVSAVSTPLASFRAKILEQTAAFYRMPARIDQLQQAVNAAAARRSSLTTSQQARLIAAENGLAAGRKQWASTDQAIAQVNVQLSTSDTAKLVTSVPGVVAGVATTKQLLDGVDRALGDLKGLAPAATSTAAKVGISIGAIVVLGGIAYFATRKG